MPEPKGSKSDYDYAEYIKRLRGRLELTQEALAEHLGVSFATVNRWENNKTKPSKLYWNLIQKLEVSILEEKTSKTETFTEQANLLDFTSDPEKVKILSEGERLSYGHLINPTFATEIANIDPLPHQRIAVYKHMLTQQRLRFLLADDAGAGKTIMSGLYIREMISRRLLDRILIVTPAGLVGNWRRELLTLFNIPFRIVSGNDARNNNPFLGEFGKRIIISIDTLASNRMYSRLRESEVLPYDLVIFDEAHKLSADRGNDMRIRKTDRYCLAEALAGITDIDEHWQLNWSANHFLLLTATPHMGKDYPYYALWRLLEPQILTTPGVFNEFPTEQRRVHFIRRTKEEMRYLDGSPLYPKRISDTLGYDLNQGEVSEQTLYNETTEYLSYVYNRAKLLNREAARLAMSVFQRRLASSTFALLRSFERRIDKLDKLIDDVRDGRLTAEQLVTIQNRISDEIDILESKTADEESTEEGFEENELAEDRLLQGVVAASLTDLLAEKEQVKQLLDLARKIHDRGHESKFDKLREVLTEPRLSGEKFIIFTEHRDTLDFLVRRLDGMGYTGQVAQIHGGMNFLQREESVDHFKLPIENGGARFLVCTDAAGEGINLQFCWIMINYDVPWNPARLEQRMGRIHRYGQKHDPVVILNLVASKTREGKVLKVLLEKLEKIRKELQSDKVFDCIGRIFQDVSIKQYMEIAATGDPDEIVHQLDRLLTKEQVEAVANREKSIFGNGEDVVNELPELRNTLEQEMYFKLIPGFTRKYIIEAAPLLNIGIDGDMGGVFEIYPTKFGAFDPFYSSLEIYPEKSRNRFSVSRIKGRNDFIWLHPGEPVFEKLRSLASEKLSNSGSRGALFIDPSATKPYLFHLALLRIVRKSDTEYADLTKEEILDCRLVGVKQFEGAEITLCPVEHLLLLKGGSGLPAVAQRLAVAAKEKKELARSFLVERVARGMALERKKKLDASIPEREGFIRKGFDYQEGELATARARHAEKARKGNRKAVEALEDIKRQQRLLSSRREQALAILRREPELIAPDIVTFVAHALVVPSSDPEDRKMHDANVEMAAMRMATAFEESVGGTVQDVHTPELARAAGLPDNPGFDLLSTRPGGEKLAIEVKGRAETGDIEVSANEWARACNMRDGYWLYAVYNCASPNPRLVRVQDPFGNLLAKAKGSVLISLQAITQAAGGKS